MNPFVLSCCSVVDLSTKVLEERNIEMAPFHFNMNGTEYLDDMGKTLSSEEFYQAMVDGAEVSTSQVNMEEYIHYFEKFLAEGKDVLHITLSSGLSGSYNSARIAAEDLREKYPERKLYLVDSLAASAGGGLLMDTLADRRDAGDDIDTLYRWAEDNKLRLHHWFTASDLTWFVKGGRITKAAGWFGTVLKICPVLNVDNQGRLIPRFKIRGKQKSLKELVLQMVEHAEGGKSYAGKCFISNSACKEDARYVADEVEKNFPQLNGSVQIYNIGPTIGCHTGPGTVALFFWGDPRTE
ncbi:MAG: DegV family protein [Ruminococcaceae bacterium]|nr:DegV family protein [Oscillospiraceae bacterium]